MMNRSIKLRLFLATTAAVAAFSPVVRATSIIYDGGPAGTDKLERPCELAKRR